MTGLKELVLCALFVSTSWLWAGQLTAQSGPDRPVEESKKKPTKDIEMRDDVMVRGGLCVGPSCVNEAFGFATQILKSERVRLRFHDTSTQAGYANDTWQLTINDSGHGGQTRFSIENVSGGRTPFTILDAPDHSLFVDTEGEVGVGTSAPSADLHVMSRDTPTLRLEQSGAGGFAPQTWDIRGNDLGFAVRDETEKTFPLFIEPAAPTESVHIDENGHVGLGTSSPATKLHVTGAVTATDFVGESVEIGGWRIHVTGGGELEFSIASGGAYLPAMRLNDRGQVNPISLEVAEGDPASASSENPILPAYDAFDFDPTTVWQSQGVGPQWLSVDLGSLHLLDEVTDEAAESV